MVPFAFDTSCAIERRQANSGANAVGRCGQTVHAHANRIVNGIEDRGRGRNHRLLADPFGAERADRRRIFDEDRFDRRHVAGRGNQIVVKVLAFAGKKFLHQRHPQSLRGAAFDLSFDKRWIDGAAHVVRRGDLQNPHCAQFRIDRNLRQVRAESDKQHRECLDHFRRAGWWADRKWLRR